MLSPLFPLVPIFSPRPLFRLGRNFLIFGSTDSIPKAPVNPSGRFNIILGWARAAIASLFPAWRANPWTKRSRRW
jgi:hypothetical protein